MTNPSPQGGETNGIAALAGRTIDVLNRETATLRSALHRATQENKELKQRVDELEKQRDDAEQADELESTRADEYEQANARLRALLVEAQEYLAARSLGEPAQKLLTRLNAELGGRTQ